MRRKFVQQHTWKPHCKMQNSFTWSKLQRFPEKKRIWNSRLLCCIATWTRQYISNITRYGNPLDLRQDSWLACQDVSWHTISTVLWARCAGALSCWKTNTSPAVLQITSSSSCISNTPRCLLILLTASVTENEAGITEFRYGNRDLTDLLKVGCIRRRRLTLMPCCYSPA